MYTLDEIKLLLATQYDEVALLEMLGIDTDTLVERFSDQIEENMDYFEKMVSDDNCSDIET